MIEISNFLEMKEEYINKVYDLFKESNKESNIKKIEEYETHCKSSHFNFGNDYYILTEGDMVKAILGLITKPIEESGDAYITDVSCKEEDKKYLDFLFKQIKKKTINLKDHTLKAGFKENNSYVEEILLNNGGINPYEILEMKYTNNEEIDNIESNSLIGFELLNKEKESEYIYVHNESFKNSPNGSTIQVEDMKEVFENYNKYSFYEIAILKENNNPIGFYEVLIDNGVGEIDSIGVIPEFQRKGYGLQILKKAVEVLKGKNPVEIKLIVVSTNENAFKMYKKYGFEVEKIHSKWYELAY